MGAIFVAIRHKCYLVYVKYCVVRGVWDAFLHQKQVMHCSFRVNYSVRVFIFYNVHLVLLGVAKQLFLLIVRQLFYTIYTNTRYISFTGRVYVLGGCVLVCVKLFVCMGVNVDRPTKWYRQPFCN